jgi:hypothetical protein
VHRHLVMFASLFLFLWAAISTGCSSKRAEESSDLSAPSSKSASLFGSKEVTLPAGTVLTVRLASTVGSKTNNTGDRFNATIATPVELDGKVVLPKGAEEDVFGMYFHFSNDKKSVKLSPVSCFDRPESVRISALSGSI